MSQSADLHSEERIKVVVFITCHGIVAVLFFCVLCFPAESTAAWAEGYSLNEYSGENERISGKILGRRGGYFHFFLDVTEIYTDNFFNTAEDKESDFISVISPGVWFSWPRSDGRILHLNTSTVSPSGMAFSRITVLGRPSSEAYKRYQTYLCYSPDFEYHSRFASEDLDSHEVEALFEYNSTGGFSAEMISGYVKSTDPMGTGELYTRDKYTSNLFSSVFTFDLSERLLLRADYTRFQVNYYELVNDFRDRYDDEISGYIFFKLRPRTALFAEYDFVEIDYVDGLDSTENHYFGGLQWEITDRSNGIIKAGTGTKDFVDAEVADSEDFILESQIKHKIDNKRSLTLKGLVETGESNVSSASHIFSRYAGVRYKQDLGARYQGSLDVSYKNSAYRNAGTEVRNDDLFIVSLAFGYKLNKWLKTYIAYAHTTRESSVSEYDFISNTILLKVSGTL
jgi:hypothetical protein